MREPDTILVETTPGRMREVPRPRMPVPPAGVDAQFIVNAKGIGDHMMALTVTSAWKAANPTKRLALVAQHAQWVELFGGYDELHVGRESAKLPRVRPEINDRGGLHFVEAVARCPDRRLPVAKPLPDDAVAWAERYRGAVVLAPMTLAGGAMTRNWLLPQWHDLERLLNDRGLSCVTIAGGGDGPRVRGSRGAVELGRPASHVAALMRAARAVVSNESGMAHLAGALGVPCVVLCAQLPGREIHGFWPGTTVLQAPMPCSPCRWSGPEWRPRCDTICAALQAITPDSVVHALRLDGPRVPLSTDPDTARAVESHLDRLTLPNDFSGACPLTPIDRRPTMRLFLEHLASRPRPLAVETGCQRADLDYGAGMSTTIFGLVLRGRGRLTSLDLDAGHVEFCRSRVTGLPVEVVATDSRPWLRDYAGAPIDGLYLDSCDTYTPGHRECSLEEARLALPHLRGDAAVLVDDTWRAGGAWQGKGGLSVPWLVGKGFEVVKDGYQALLRRRRHPLLVVSGYTDGYGAPWAGRFAAGKRDYCVRHGYGWRLRRDGFDGDRHPAWSKVEFVRQALAEAEWACWLDADAEIRNPDFELASLTATDADLVITSDANGPNSGVWLIRSCDWSRQFLDEVWASHERYAEHRWWENAAFHELVPRHAGHVKILPSKGLNSYVTDYTDGDFLLHYAGDKSVIP